MIEQSLYGLGIDRKDANFFWKASCRPVEIRAAADVPVTFLS